MKPPIERGVISRQRSLGHKIELKMMTQSDFGAPDLKVHGPLVKMHHFVVPEVLEFEPVPTVNPEIAPWWAQSSDHWLLT